MGMLNSLLDSLRFYYTDILNIKTRMEVMYSLVHHLFSCSFAFKPLTAMPFKILDNEF